MFKNNFLKLALLALVVLAIPLTSQALVAKSGDSVNIGETVDGNFFAAGNLVTISGTVNGDVFVASNSVIISGTVNGDVFVAGSDINISGFVDGNVRALGSNINITGQVERNILAAGSSLIVGQEARVGRHLTFAGSSLSLSGLLEGQLDAAVASATVTGNVESDVFFELGQEGVLVLAEQAIIGGDLAYSAETKEQAVFNNEDAVLGETVFRKWDQKKLENKKNPLIAFFGFVQLANLISLFVIGLLFIYLFNKPMEKIYLEMKNNFWKNLALGFVFLVVTPVVAFLLMVTVVGVPLGLILFVMYFVSLYLMKAVGALFVGKFIFEKFKWQGSPIWIYLAGLVILTVISFIPIGGGFVCFLITLYALGAFLKIKKEYLQKLK